ncbi:coiled-coil domain-containing protein lobo [Toxorhynchites rutilus septentrionalis]|uniref:coiled-coil domain-containing protein lobo n=1 Tax=Toxorhynchites rutilus septentrionalis TaxID=329112 RepID=UPI00247ACC30|nr:coiled-coil domain-containing protein lobo [Toxorhynchites rutilus septentrionalis]
MSSARKSDSVNVSDILRQRLRNNRSKAREQLLPPPTPGKAPVPVGTPEGSKSAIASESVAGVKAKLGLIDTCFPECETPAAFEEITSFPDTYGRLSSKEKLVLLFAENFRRQYKEKFPQRKPPILALPNECGVQKFVCTTLRPSIFLFPDLIGSWEEIASFVADYIVYEPLKDQVNMPTRLLSPDTVLRRRKANSFELATLLCSYLIGNGFAACVVSGYATREIVNNDQRRVACPYIPCQTQETKDEEVIEPCKYQLTSPPDLRSRYLLELEEEKAAKIKQEELKREEVALKELEDLERPVEDTKRGHRIHAWVVVLRNAPWCYKPGYRETTIDPNTGEKVLMPPSAFFIEPASGFRFEVDTSCYLGIESVWNQHNYYVNKQEPITDIKNLRWDFKATKDWEHLLPGEPYELREDCTVPEDQEPLTTEEELEKEKHLDLPSSWVGPLSISMADFEKRFPDGSKVIYFKRAIYERFAPYSNMVGLIKRLTLHETLDYENPTTRWEWYINRDDSLTMIIHEYAQGDMEEVFASGRHDSLKTLRRSNVADKECRLTFFHQYRFDSLKELVYHPSYVQEHYHKREDLLFFREFKNIPKDSVTMEDCKLTQITEKFDRNPDKPAVRDIATRTCFIDENRILLKFHYGEDCITASTREFIKPPKSEMGEEVPYDPNCSTGYISNPWEPQPTQLELFLLLKEQLKAEDNSTRAFYRRVWEIETLLVERKKQLESPKLSFSLFDPLRNEEARRVRLERYELIRAREELLNQEHADFLAPYLLRLQEASCSPEQLMTAYQHCQEDLRKFYQKLEQELKARLDELVSEEQSLKRFLAKFQEHFEDEEYEKFVLEGENIELNKNVVQMRMENLRDEYQQKVDYLEKALREDDRLGGRSATTSVEPISQLSGVKFT